VNNREREEQLIYLYDEVYKLTLPECRQCRKPLSCCSAEYCELAIDYAKDVWGVILAPTDHPNLPGMGVSGCVIPPHLRPMCTFHVCSISSLGTMKDATKNEKYFELRSKIDVLENELTEEV
jgi:hypothetical protein